MTDQTDVTSEPVISLRRPDGVHVLRLNRPAKRNALDRPTLDVLVARLAELAVDGTVRALVLSTTNVRAFCAGADVGEQLDEADGLARMIAFTRLYSTLAAVPVPVLCVCVGNCVGAGAELAAGSDLRVGGDNLKLAWAGARLGVPVGPARLAPLIGVARAKDLIFTGRTVDAREADALGLLTRVVAADDAEDSALELASAIASAPPDGIRELKRMFTTLDDTPRRVAYENDLLTGFQQHGAGLPRAARPAR